VTLKKRIAIGASIAIGYFGVGGFCMMISDIMAVGDRSLPQVRMLGFALCGAAPGVTSDSSLQAERIMIGCRGGLGQSFSSQWWP